MKNKEFKSINTVRHRGGAEKMWGLKFATYEDERECYNNILKMLEPYDKPRRKK